jgi:hypothetical protein
MMRTVDMEGDVDICDDLRFDLGMVMVMDT